MIDIKDKKDCCGCNACGDVCPQGAITFAADEEGFLYPKVDSGKCVGCGLCDRACPQLHAGELRQDEFQEPRCYAATHKNFSILFDSTSGGAFSALANVVYRKGGYVGGAIWDDDFSIRQYISEKKSDLPRLRSSKYAQSDARGFYSAVKAALETGKPVLVCGCPCQLFALKAFLGKGYVNLTMVDFICRGNNSPLVFRRYLDWQEEKNGGKVVYVKPKNKELGWRNLTTKLVFDNGKVVYDTRDTSYFTKGYLATNAYCRPSCYACQFKGIPRVADVTVADFWGAEGIKLAAGMDRNLGTSLVLVNNSKGAALFAEASPSMLTQELSFAQAIKGNPMIDQSLPPPVCDRREFFKVLRDEGFEGVAKKFIEKPRGESCARTDLRARLGRIKRLVRQNLLHPIVLYRLIRANGIKRILLCDTLIRPQRGGCHCEIEGELNLGADLLFGDGYYQVPVARTFLAVRAGGKLTSLGPLIILNGADIEVFPNGCLEFGYGCGTNVSPTIICSDHIKIGNNVIMGRHVTIRDNNGSHWMNLPGYKDTKPVEIGDHVWLCEGCTIMPGVKIGAGAVIGAKAVVFNNVPANTLVMGNPAQVVCEQVEWKY